MDLQDPDKKMSKSTESTQGIIGLLLDDPKTIERKVKRAVTDADDGPDAVRYDPVSQARGLQLAGAVSHDPGSSP